MTPYALVYALHVLAALVWVGGMFFAWTILRPAAVAALEAPARLGLWLEVFRRFFHWVWAAVILLPISGVGMLHLSFNGFAGAPRYVQVMMGLYVAMLALFLRVQALQVPELAPRGAGPGLAGRQAGAGEDPPHRWLQPAPRPVADSPGSGTPEPLNWRCAGSRAAGRSSEAHDVEAAVAAVGAVRAVLSAAPRTTGIHRVDPATGGVIRRTRFAGLASGAADTALQTGLQALQRKIARHFQTNPTARPPGPPSLPDWPSPPFSALPQKQPEALPEALSRPS